MTAPVLEARIEHLDLTPTCGCGCHADAPVDAAHAVRLHGCLVLLRCESCAVELHVLYDGIFERMRRVRGGCCEQVFNSVARFMQVEGLQ